MLTRALQFSALTLVTLAFANCGGGDEAGGGGGGASGASGSDAAAGTTGDASLGGSSGSGATAGVAGAAASGGSAGAGGAAGTDAGGNDAGGADAGGSAGVSGSAGGGGFDPTCYNCHGTVGSPTPAPPKDTSGNTATTAPRVGAHQSHLGASTWHAEFKCTECHLVPTALWDTGHIDTQLPAEVLWGPASVADGATPSWGGTSCSGVYCHGATIKNTGANVTPNWTTVDGSQSECGKACHTTPPGDGHPANNDCKQCHGAVINNFAGTASTWIDASKHINGIVEVVGGSLTCTSCHGNAATSDPSPPNGTKGETLTSQAAVGAHQQHLAAANWHRQVACTDCHTVPTSTAHSNAVVDFNWGGPAAADGATPTYNSSNNACAGSYCHGGTLLGPKPGGSTKTSPVWTVVDGSYDACGSSCHTNPPGPTHTTATNCPTCHGAVIQSFNPATNAATWADATLHVNGIVEATSYHDLPNWTTPKGNGNHHGSKYFLTNQQRDEHNALCSSCHGANLDGGTSGVSCNNNSCHGGDWKSCNFCHGSAPAQSNPPVGVGGETLTNTLAVGRHVAHLNASSSHVAFACSSCHAVPTAGNVSHALQYVPSAGLQTPGHHGDVAFSGVASGMTWNVNATQGNPVTARGTCVGGCHSNGNGGPPNVTPYWAGGSWTTPCNNCHSDPPNNGEHDKHVNGENLPCSSCHFPANSATHLNGQTDVRTNINGPSGGGVTYNPNACGNGNPGCTGTCHGESHNAECW